MEWKKWQNTWMIDVPKQKPVRTSHLVSLLIYVIKSPSPYLQHLPIYRIRYEDLVTDPVQQVKKILKFIKFPDMNEGRIQCAVKTSCQANNACRQGSTPGGSKNKNSTRADPFDEETTRTMMETLGSMLQELGYDGKNHIPLA